MNINELTELVIRKIKSVGAYSELPENNLRNSIKKHLLDTHKKELDDALVRLDNKQKNGYQIQEVDYEVEQMKVEETVLLAAKMIAVTNKKELQNLV